MTMATNDIFQIPPVDAQQNNNEETVDTITSQQLEAINAAEQQSLNNLDQMRAEWEAYYNQYQDPVATVEAIAQSRKKINPRAIQARQAIGSLYDALQIIGSAATKGTAPSPVLTSAAAQQATIAEKLNAQQLAQEQDYLNLRQKAFNERYKQEKQKAETFNKIDTERAKAQRFFEAQRQDVYNRIAKKKDAEELENKRQQNRKELKGIPQASANKPSSGSKGYFNVVVGNEKFKIPSVNKVAFNADAIALFDAMMTDAPITAKQAKQKYGSTLPVRIIQSLAQGKYIDGTPLNPAYKDLIEQAREIVRLYSDTDVPQYQPTPQEESYFDEEVIDEEVVDDNTISSPLPILD